MRSFNWLILHHRPSISRKLKTSNKSKTVLLFVLVKVNLVQKENDTYINGERERERASQQAMLDNQGGKRVILYFLFAYLVQTFNERIGDSAQDIGTRRPVFRGCETESDKLAC